MIPHSKMLFLEGSLVEEDCDGFDLPLVDPVEVVEVEVPEELSEPALLEAGEVGAQLLEVDVHALEVLALLGHLAQVVGQFQLGLETIEGKALTRVFALDKAYAWLSKVFCLYAY